MKNNKKMYILNILATSVILTGCVETKRDIEEDLKPIDEWVVADDSKDEEETILLNKDSEKESIIELDNKEDDEKLGENKLDLSEDSNLSNGENSKEDVFLNSNKDNSSYEQQIILLDNPIFEKSDISESIKNRMNGKSMPSHSTVGFDELSYLTITYLDYNGDSKQGEMVVHKSLADEVLDIFREIYMSKFPIERMNLVDDYNASDHASMVNNNTSAFCYRTIAGSNKVSNHGKGMAIDINPFYNPHVLKSKGTVNPPEASKYSNRALNEKGMIKYGDVVYKAFISRGWKWGGSWNNPDYQHFEKNI